MIKLLAFVPCHTDGTAFYRSSSVLSELHKIDNSIQITSAPNAFRWIEAKGFDIAFFQRPDNGMYVETIKALKAMGIPIVVEYDDYLLRVPRGNRYHTTQVLNDNPYENHVANALKFADQVIVSTDALRELFLKFNPNITVIRNAFDDYCFKPCPTFNKYSRKVLWRGGATHQPDFNFYGDEVVKLVKDNPDFEFTFWTEMFQRPENMAYYAIADYLHKMPNFKVQQATATIDYMQGLQRMKPALMLSVNVESEFNYGKSDCCKLEGFYCGALCVHPDWPEWTWGKMHIGEKYLFDRANYMLLQIRNPNSKAMSEIYNLELNYVKENRLLSKVNKQRAELFRSMVNER